jgi:hypothetical protein
MLWIQVITFDGVCIRWRSSLSKTSAQKCDTVAKGAHTTHLYGSAALRHARTATALVNQPVSA